jgi:hypothetical protein
MRDQLKLTHAVNAVTDAARAFNIAVSEAADAGLLVEVTLVDDPDITKGATPRPRLAVTVHCQGDLSARAEKEAAI